MAKQPTGAGGTADLDESVAGGGLRVTLTNFDTDGDELKDEHRAFLDAKVVPRLNTDGTMGLSAAGKAGSAAPEARNPGLATRRADAVLSYVESKGIEHIRMWLADTSKVDGGEAGARAVTVLLTSRYDPALDAEFQRLNGLSMTPQMPDLLTELNRQTHARLTELRAHVAQAKGIDVGRVMVALDAVMNRGPRASFEWKSVIAAEAAEFLPTDATQQEAINEFMATRAGGPTFRRPAAPLPRVKSSKITIGGVPFRDWFNKTFWPAQQPADKARSIKEKRWLSTIGSGYTLCFDRLSDLTGQAELSFNGFVGYFLIGYNETGASFSPRTEVPQVTKDQKGTFYEDKYFFEPNPAIPKSSYNSLHPAGAFLKSKGIISLPADTDAWDSTTKYPMDQPDSVKTAARDAEFYKFRGRGFVQHTFRAGYEPLADVLKEKSGGKTLDQLSNAELDTLMKDPDVYLIGAQKYMRQRGILGTGAPNDKLAAVDQDPPDFTVVAKAVAGVKAVAYHRKLVGRAAELLNAIIDSGDEVKAE